MNTPARLPATDADLDEWSVFVDWLLQIDDPRAEFLAYEMSLPAEPDHEELATFLAMARKWCRSRPATPTTWCLGHARTMDIAGDRPMSMAYPRARTDPSTGAYASATELLKTAAGSRVERLAIPAPFDSVALARHWHRLMQALPASCREVELDVRGGVSDRDTLIGSLPDHVDTLVFGADHLDVAASLIDDRFTSIELRARFRPLGEAVFPRLHAALERTSHVVIRVTELHASGIHPRIELGGATDAALVQPWLGLAIAPHYADVGRMQQQRHVLPVRAQLHHPEVFRVDFGGDGRLLVNPAVDGQLMRRGDDWTLYGIESRVLHNGRVLRPRERVPLRDRDTITIGEAPPIMFVASAADVRSVLGGSG